MRARRSFALSLILASAFASAASLVAPSAAFAQSDADRATARDLAIEGYKALEAKDYVTAADKFTRADSLYHAPTVSLGLARARAALGKLVGAQEAYSKAIHSPEPPNPPPAFTKAIEEAKAEYAALAPRVPGVIINVKGTDAPIVKLDGVDVPVAALGVKRPVDPGKHSIVVNASGFSTGEASFTVAEGKTETVVIELKPGLGPVVPPVPGPGPGLGAPGPNPVPVAPPGEQGDPNATRRTVGFVGIGLGGAGLIMGVATGVVAIGKHSDIAKSCPDSHCPKGSEGTYDSKISSYNTMGTLSTVGFVAGGVLAAGGLVLVLTAPKPKQTVGRVLVPVLAPGYVGAEGTF